MSKMDIFYNLNNNMPLQIEFSKVQWKKNSFLGYGWGYIGRGLKGGFKPKSGSKNQFGSNAQKTNIVSLGRKSGRNLFKMGYF